MKLFSKISIMVFLLFICLFISGADSLQASWPFIGGNSTYDDVFKDVCTINGYVYSGGYTVDGTDTSFYLVKFDLNGNLEWENVYGDSSEDEVFTCMTQSDELDHIILAGNRKNNDIPFIIKVNETGSLIETFVDPEFPDPDEVTIVGEDNGGGDKYNLYHVFVGSQSDEIFIMKIDSDFNPLSYNSIRSSEDYDQAIANGVKIISVNKYMIVGSCNQWGTNYQYITSIESNREGQLESSWDVILSPGELFTIEEDPNTQGIYYAVGYDNDVSPTRIKLICFINGSVIWTSYASGAGPDVDEIGYDIVFSAGDIYVVGTTVNAAGIEGTIISKFLTDGTYDNSVRTYSSYNQGLYSTTQNNYFFVVAGYSKVFEDQKDAYIYKSCPWASESIGGTGGAMSSNSASSGIINTNGTNIILYQVLPCIFSKEAHINFSLPLDRYVELKIYDITGSEIKILTSSYMSSGEYRFIWNRDDNSGLKVSYGIYFCKLIVDGEVFTRKITLTQ